MLGGAFLSYEGAEKVIEKLGGASTAKDVGRRDPLPGRFRETSGWRAQSGPTLILSARNHWRSRFSALDLDVWWERRNVALALVAVVSHRGGLWHGGGDREDR